LRRASIGGDLSERFERRCCHRITVVAGEIADPLLDRFLRSLRSDGDGAFARMAAE